MQEVIQLEKKKNSMWWYQIGYWSVLILRLIPIPSFFMLHVEKTRRLGIGS